MAVTLVTVAIVAAVTAAALGAWSLGAVLTATGLPDSGPLTTLGLPAVRALGETAAVIAISGFLFAAFLVPAQPNGVLDASGYRAIRLGAVACGIWAICAALMVALSVSDVSGRPVTDLTPAQIWSAAALVETTNAWRWTAAVAATVAGVVALGIANASDELQNERTYTPQAQMGTGCVSWGPVVLPGEEAPDPDDVDAAIEIAARLADYVTVLEPLRRQA